MRRLVATLCLTLVPASGLGQGFNPYTEIVSDRLQVQPMVHTVEVSAGQLMHTAQSQGADVGRWENYPVFPPSCNAWVQGYATDAEIYAEYLATPVIGPRPPGGDDPIFGTRDCVLRILDYNLTNGWTLDELRDIEGECSTNATFTVERVSGNLADMQHRITISTPMNGGYCTITIETAIMTGPFGQTWNNGL